MKKKVRKSKKIVKGTASGFLISLLVHGAAFLLAGLLVVFTVYQKEEKKFEPPQPVDRPKMKLKKPKVKVKKNAKPQSTTRIVTKIQKADMPDIHLPELGGMGTGLEGGSGIGGFDLASDLSAVSLLGNTTSIGSDLEGVFYDFKRDRNGRNIPVDTTGAEWREMIRKFFVQGWKPSVLSRYYRAPQKLYATTLVVPVTQSGIVPEAFGDDDAVGALWMVHYKGELVNSRDIKFRFWGVGDEFMVVRVDGEIVLGAWWPDQWYGDFRGAVLPGLWESSSLDSEKYLWGNEHAVVGDWIELKAGKAKDIEILIGDNGGQSCFILGVQEEGVEYERSGQPAPILPAFRTAPLSHEVLDVIYKELPAGDVCLTNGPVFNDYASPAAPRVTIPPPNVDDGKPSAEPAPEKLLWTLADSRTFEASFLNIVGGKAVFKTPRGKLIKLTLDELSFADREYIELSNPPKLDLNFTRDMEQELFSEGFYGDWPRPPETHAQFGVRIKQTSSGVYNHKLNAELFAVGLQRTRPDKKYILLDRRDFSFSLTKENGRKYEFLSDHDVVLTNFDVREEPRGEKYFGYLVVVRDVRGKIVAIKASNDWLADNVKRMEKLAIGNYFDKTCERVYPGRPRPLGW